MLFILLIQWAAIVVNVTTDVWRWLLQPNNALMTILINVWVSRFISHREHRKNTKAIEAIRKTQVSE